MNLNKVQRRVPDQLRKRAAVSCDFCKIRRRKCVRATTQSSCKLCLENRLECVSTIPRKPRPHRLGDEASSQASHYRALEDLVSKLFPGVNLDDTEEITQLSREIDQGNGTESHNNSVSPWRASGAENSSISNAASSGATNEPQNYNEAHENYSIPIEDPPTTSISTSFYERMLQSPSGTLSYFGSASSMAYVRKMRELLAAVAEGQPGSGSVETLRHTFINDPYARTMGEDQGAVPGLPAIEYIQLSGQNKSGQSSARLLKLLESLPNKRETDDLIDSFFAHVHINVALFHRSSFQAALDRIRSPGAQDIDVGWTVCLRLAIAFGCEWRLSTSRQITDSDRERLTSLRSLHVKDSFSEISHLMISGTLQSVTAFALLSVYMSFANERNAAYILSSCAIRMAIGLGLHRGENVVHRSDIYLTPLEQELRKQIWCSLYIFEQYSSAFLGRPSAVDGVEIIVELPKESLLDLGYFWPPGYFKHDVSLARIVGSIRDAQVNQNLSLSNGFEGLPDIGLCHEFLQKLDDWRSALPSFLEFDESKLDDVYPSHLRQILMIHVRYQYARIMLCRPFLLKALYVSHGLKGEVLVDPQILKYKDVCFQAALDCWTLIHCLWKRRQYNAHLWLDGLFAYQCNLILSLYLLDTSNASDLSQPQKIHEMVKQTQDILQKGPGNKTMRRLIQISRDFSEIVSATSPNLEQNDTTSTSTAYAETASNEHQIPNIQNTFVDVFSNIPHIQNLDPAVIGWQNMMMSNIFHSDFVGEGFMFDPLADLQFEPMESQNL